MMAEVIPFFCRAKQSGSSVLLLDSMAKSQFMHCRPNTRACTQHTRIKVAYIAIATHFLQGQLYCAKQLTGIYCSWWQQQNLKRLKLESNTAPSFSFGDENKCEWACVRVTLICLTIKAIEYIRCISATTNECKTLAHEKNIRSNYCLIIIAVDDCVVRFVSQVCRCCCIEGIWWNRNVKCHQPLINPSFYDCSQYPNKTENELLLEKLEWKSR